MAKRGARLVNADNGRKQRQLNTFQLWENTIMNKKTTPNEK